MDLDPIELTRTLVAIESTTGQEAAVAARLAQLLERAGWQVTLQPVTGGRHNVYAHRGDPVVVFSTHLDTVPPYVPLREDDEHLWGRGTCDAKGIAAAMVAAAERLAARGERRTGLLFLVGEENGSDGAHAAHALGPKGRFVVNGEPTENVLTIGQKGSLRVDLAATGRAAHSAYPAEGHSAIEPLLDTIDAIRRLQLPVDEVLGPSTLNIGLLQGGVAPNVIPPHASAQILVRTVEPTDPLKERIRACARPGVSVDFPVELPLVKGATAPPGWRAGTVSFASDLPFLAPWGESFQLGPGTIRVAHTDEERIAKAELLEGVELYVRLANDLLARGAA
jgi:acetylornithine deacetylase